MFAVDWTESSQQVALFFFFFQFFKKNYSSSCFQPVDTPRSYFVSFFIYALDGSLVFFTLHSKRFIKNNNGRRTISTSSSSRRFVQSIKSHQDGEAWLRAHSPINDR